MGVGGSVVIPQLPPGFHCQQTMLTCATAMGNNYNTLSPWLSCVMRRSAQDHPLSQTPLF